MNNEIISRSLGISPIIEHEEETETETVEDYEFIRSNYRDMIKKTSSLLDESIEIAKQSQSPRSFEAAATLLRAISEVNKDLLNLNEKKTKKIQADDSKTVNNNTVFVGSTAELHKFISEMKKSHGGN